jgi:hypothetical protein
MSVAARLIVISLRDVRRRSEGTYFVVPNHAVESGAGLFGLMLVGTV